MMSTSTGNSVVLDKRTDRIAVVTISRPDARNAVNSEVALALEAVVDDIENDPNIWVAVLAGAGGKVFSAGADLKEVALGNMAGLSTARNGFAGFVHASRTKPWIAAVEGLALAGGCEIALACDLIVASENGAFGLPEVTRGLVAAAGGLYRLARAIPRAIAIELILTGGRLSAERAAALGLVNHLAPSGGALDRAVILALSIVANAPIAVRESLRVASCAADLDDLTLRRLSESAQSCVMKTEDFLEGPRAFLEKRPPVWRGR